MSEIDDIFASKGKTKLAVPKASTSAATVKKDLSASSSKKEKKRKRSNSIPSSKPVETIVDPSSQPLPPTKRLKVSKKPEASKEKSICKKEKEDEDKFKDSRGTGPRRKTEEGWSIYKVDELGIDEEAGGTPLCPFDCDCCF